MKIFRFTQIRLIWAISLFAIVLSACSSSDSDRHVIVLFTNDTHSQIDPLGDNVKNAPGMGGIERRKVLIDSIRAKHPDLLLVDAGDVVQGTPFFTVFGGEVETMALNELGYDVRTLGNHEFDNGLEALAAMLTASNAVTVSTNYNVSGTPLEQIVRSSAICNAGDVKVGFIGLCVQPDGLIDASHYAGMTYSDPVSLADSAASALRNEGADIVIALSHLGYSDDNHTGNPVDSMIIQNSRFIDLVIGGHSHSLLMPPSQFYNLDGRPIVVAQTGKSGAYLGYADLTIPADKRKPVSVDYRLLPVDARYDNRLDASFSSKLNVYRHTIDSLMDEVLGRTTTTLEVGKPESALTNWVTDALVSIARERTGKPVDFAVVNTGGVRTDFGEGNLTRGNLFEAFPFDNRLSVVELRGSDVRELFDVIAMRGGEGVSREIRLVICDGKTQSLSIGSKALDDNRTYTIATLDYVANGGDMMSPFTRAVARTDYPDPVRSILEAHIEGLTAQGKCIEAATDGRISMKETHSDK